MQVVRHPWGPRYILDVETPIRTSHGQERGMRLATINKGSMTMSID